MAKPTNPNINFPEAFAVEGQKTDFLDEKIQSGFDPVDPDVLAGDNLNKFIDDTYKGLHYSMNGVNDLYKGTVLYDENETYTDKSIVFNIDENGETGIYRSLISNNTGNALTDGTKWQNVNLGGSGFEVGDIGIAAFGVDETKGLRRLLNGTILTVNANNQTFVNKLKAAVTSYPTLACTEAQWQEITSTSVGGQCGKFVLNYDDAGTTVVSVRLPKIIMPVQGLTDMTKLGELVEAGLPNIEGEASLWDTTGLVGNGQASGAIKLGTSYNTAPNIVSGHPCYGLAFDASGSNDIYGNSSTVQQEQAQYPYFIQIATGQETEVNITNEIELNNPYTLFDSKYSEAPLYNASWLLSNGTYYAKSSYVTAYEALVVENNTEIDEGDSVTLPSGTSYVKRGLSVKFSTADDISDYDYVINTTDETFRLPLLDGSEALPGDKFENVTLNGSNNTYTAPANGWYSLGKKASADGGLVGMCNLANTMRTQSAVHYANQIPRVFIPVKRNDTIEAGYENANGNLESFRFIYAQGRGSLYFYVGETVQNANLINAGRIAEQINLRGAVVESYKNGTSWYRIWSDGWIEQGGIYDIGSYTRNWNDTAAITFLKSFTDTNYTFLVTKGHLNNTNRAITFGANKGTQTGIRLNCYGINDGDTCRYLDWYACGY